MGLAQGVHKGPSFAIKSLTYSQSKIWKVGSTCMMQLMLSGLLLTRAFQKDILIRNG